MNKELDKLAENILEETGGNICKDCLKFADVTNHQDLTWGGWVYKTECCASDFWGKAP